jgi:hypothetical protein
VEGKLTGASLVVRIVPTLTLGESSNTDFTKDGVGNRKKGKVLKR